MESDDETIDIHPRLIPIGMVNSTEVDAINPSEQNEYLQECISKQTKTINYLKEMALSANLKLDSNRIIDPTVTLDPINGWSLDNDALLQTWKNQLFSSSFVYGVVLEKYNSRFKQIQIISAIMSTIITLLGVILSTLETNDIWINRGIGIAVAIIGGGVTVLTNIIKINGWDTYTNTISKLIQNLDNLYARVTNESYLPKLDRIPANEFITTFQKDLNQVTQNQPHISVTDYQFAEKLYNEDQARIQNLVINRV